MSGRICPDCEKSTDLETCPHCGSPTLDRTPFLHREDTLIGKLVNGRYLVQELLGAGGMGKVYVAEQVAMKRQVALKVIRIQDSGEVSEKMSVYKRFQQEALASSRLEHHNTVRVFDFGIAEDGTLFIAMELLRGTTLTKIMRAGPMAPARAIRIAIQLCRSLAEAHQKGIVHRDLKPDNIMVFDTLGESDFVKLLDFGIAKITAVTGESSITRTGLIMGTPAYMAPEQANSGAIGPATDLYALGVILYEALTGHPPFTGGTPLAVLMKHVSEEVPPIVVDGFPPDVPQQLVDIVFRLLEKKPVNRPASALEVARLLESVDVVGSTGGNVHAPAGVMAGKPAGSEIQVQTSSLVPTDPLVKTGYLGYVDPVVKTKHLGQAEPVVKADNVRPEPVSPGAVPTERSSGVESTDAMVLKLRNPRRWWIPVVVVVLILCVAAAAAIWIGSGGSKPVRGAAVDAHAVTPDVVQVVEDARKTPDVAAVVDVARQDRAQKSVDVIQEVRRAPVPAPAPAPSPVPVPAPSVLKPVKVEPVKTEVKPDAVEAVKKTEVRPAPKKPSLPRCVRSKCPFNGDCVDSEGRRINGALFCDDLNI